MIERRIPVAPNCLYRIAILIGGDSLLSRSHKRRGRGSQLINISAHARKLNFDIDKKQHTSNNITRELYSSETSMSKKVVPSSSSSREEVWATLPKMSSSEEQTAQPAAPGIPDSIASVPVSERLSVSAGCVGIEGLPQSSETQVRLTSSLASLSRSGLVSMASPKQNCPTAKVAPIVETPSRRTRLANEQVPLTLSPKLTRHTGFAGSVSGFDRASWDSEEDRKKQMAAGRLLRETLSPGRKGDVSAEKLRSLIAILDEKNQIIERSNTIPFSSPISYFPPPSPPPPPPYHYSLSLSLSLSLSTVKNEPSLVSSKNAGKRPGRAVQ